MPTVTTAASSGEISRETIVCSASTIRAAATIGSAVSCGAAPWPPRPSTSIENSSTAAMSAPRLTPIFPTGSWFQRWRPKAASTPSSTPSAAHASAPPAPFLGRLEEEAEAGSLGRARAGARPAPGRSRRGRRGRTRASSRALATRRRRRSLPSSGSASMSARRRIRRGGRSRVRHDARCVPTPGRGERPSSREAAGDDPRRPALLEAELRMAVEVAARRDEARELPGGETGEEGLETRRGSHARIIWTGDNRPRSMTLDETGVGR